MERIYKFAVYSMNAQSLQGRIVRGIDEDDLDPECPDYTIYQGTMEELSDLADSYEAMGYKNVSGYSSHWFRVADSIRTEIS